ncbi:DST [Mytilus coruscus]|uniref:DST n=1 Tax=Mytilus coruscus TaxID=42192 RepID=A0A6J8E379_MYTCO|nr:DST [Mytilus coruscus]
MISLTLDRPVTLKECFNRGLIDSNTGRVNYPKCQQQNVILGSQFRSQFSKPGPLNLLDAEKAQLIDERGQLLEPILGERITIQEAVNRNIVDGNLVLIVDEASGTKLPLKTALRQGIIDGKTCEVTNTASGEVMPLSSAIQQGLVVDSLDQKRGTVMDSSTGETVPIEQAILDGKLRSDEVTILDSRTGEMISLDSAMKKGLFDRKSGKIKDSKTGDKMTVQDALKFGLLAVVGAPILAGKVVYDAVKSTKTKGPVIKEVTEIKSKGPIITDVTEQEKNKTETIGKFTLNGEGEPQTTIIYAKPGDRIKPTMKLPTLHKNEPDLNGPENFVVSPDRSRFSQSSTSETLDISHSSLHVKPSMGFSISSEVEGSSFYKPSYPLSPPSLSVNGDSKPYGSRISDSISEQTITNTSFTSSPFISKDNLTIDWNAGKVIMRSTGEVMTVPQAVQRGLLDSDTVEELAESADLQSKTPAIDVNWDEGTITLKETREVISIDEAVNRKYIDLSTAQTLSMVVGKMHDVETKQPKMVSQVKFSPVESKTVFHERKVTTEEQKSGSLPRYSSSSKVLLKGEREPVSLNELVTNDKNVTLKGKISVPGKHKPITVQKAIEEKLIDIDNSSVLDPKTGDLISLNEAIRCGIFDPETGKLKHTGTGEKITLREAFYEGLIPQPGFSVTTYREVQSEIVDHHYSISDAIDQGMVDEGSGTFRDPKTGEVMSLGAAIYEGYISPPTSPRREVDRAEYKFTKSSPVKLRPRSKEKPPKENRLSFSQALNRGLIDVESSKFTDPSTGSRIAVLDAIRKQLIDPDDEVQETPEGFTLTAALAEGVFDDSTGEFTDRKTGRKHSLQEAIRLGFISGDSSIYDVKSGKMMTLTEALNMGRIDPKSGKFISKDSCIRISLKDAAKMGLVAFVGAPIYGAMKVKDYFTKDKPVSKSLSVSLDKSVPIDVQSTVVTRTGPENIEITEYKHKQNRDGVGDSDILESSEKVSCKVDIRGVRDSAERKDVSLDQAIRSGIIDIQHGTYKNSLTGQEMSIKEALDYGFIDGKVIDSVTMKEQTSKSGVSADVMFSEKKRMSIVSVIDPNTGQELKLHDAVHKGVIDHDGKTYFDDEHGRIIPIMDAVNQKLVRVKDVDSEMKSTELYGESKDDTITQVKTLKINTVVDPASGHSISLQDAVKRNILDLHAGVIVNSNTGEEIPISEALKMGLVSGEKSSKTETFETTSPDTLHLKSVFDADQGQFIPVKLAIEKGIINPQTGRYKEKDGSSIPITEAVHEGKIKADQKMVRSPSSAEVITERRTFNIQTIVDPRTGQTIPVPQAVQSGILDLKSGIVTNTQTGEKLSIPQAIKRGYVRADSVSEELEGLDGSKPINNVKSVKDPRTGEWLSVEEAVNRGVLDGGLCKYLDKHTGETLELEDAARRGYVQLEQTFPFVTTVKRDSMTVKAVIDPKTGTKIPLQEAIRKGIFIPDKGIVINLRTGERLPLLMAAEKGLVEIAAGSSENIVTVGDTMITEVKDPFTGRTMSLDEALKRGIVDKDKHVYYDPKTGASMPLEDALKIDLIKGESLQQNGNVDKETKDVKQINVTGVLDSSTNRQLTADQAIQKGIIDADMTKYYDAKTRTFIPMEQALQAGLVSGVVQTIKTVQTKVKSEKPAITYNISKIMDTSQGQMIDVAEAINRGVLDAKGNYKDIRRGETMPLSDAMKKGMVLATEVDGKISMSPAKATENYTFNEALGRGYIDEERGLFTHPKTGKIYTVDEAVRAGMIISSTSQPYEYSSPKEDGTTMSFQQAFQHGNIDPKNGQFGGRDRRIPMSIEEALQRQFLSPVTRQNTQQGGSVVLLKASPHTAERGAVVYTDIVDTKIPIDQTSYDEQVTMTTTTVPGKSDEKRNEPTVTVSEAFKTGKIDLETGTYNYPNTGETMSVDEAVICGFLSVDKAETIDEHVHPSNEKSPISMSDAITQGQIDFDKGTFNDPQSGSVMSLQTALQAGFIQPKVTSDSELITTSVDQYTVVKEGSPFAPKMDVKVINGEVISTTSTEIQITSGSATYVTKPGFMVDSKGKVLNTTTGDIMSLSEAAAKGLIFTESTESKSEIRFAEGKIPSLETKQQTQPESTTFFTKPEYKVDSKGKVVNTRTGDILPLSEALAKGLVFTESTALTTDLHVSEGKVNQPLVKADVTFVTKPGFVIDSKGKVTQTTTGDSITLPEAIKRGLVSTETTTPTSDLFISEETMAPSVVEQQTVKLRSKPVNGTAVDHKADEFDSGVKVTGRRSLDRSTPFDEVGALENDTSKEQGGSPVKKQIFSLVELYNRGLFDPNTGLVTDPVTASNFSLGAAVKHGLVDAVSTEVKFLDTGDFMDLDSILESGLLQEQKLQIDSNTGEIYIGSSAERS